MKISFLCCLFVVLGFSQKALFKIKDYNVYSYDFFQSVPFNDWASFDSSRQSKAFDDFLKKELVFSDAYFSGLIYSPDVFIQTEERKKQLLINNYYEKVVVRPAVDLEYVGLTQKNLKKRLLVHHILFGYNGCALQKTFQRSKEETFLFAVAAQKEIEESFLSSLDSRVSVFGSYAKKYSDDPSVSSSGGGLGWVSWGRVVPSFQNTAFSLPVGVVSSPVLTDFGYHLIFVEEEGLSDFAYYKEDLVKDMGFKFGVQGVAFDSLKTLSENHDSLILKNGAFLLNFVFADSLVSFLNKELKTSGLRGSKTSYLDILKKQNERDVLFVFNSKGFGVGWLVAKLKNFPSTRVPIIKKVDDLKKFISSLIVQQEAVLLAKKEKIQNSPVFLLDYHKNKKNIIYNEYIKKLLSSIPPIDSSLVVSAYEKGVFSQNKYMAPKKVVISELRFKTKEEVDVVFNLYVSGVSFDSLLIKYSAFGGLKKPISFGAKGVLGETAFSLKEGEVSNIVENANKSFSFFRVERFIEATPLELKNVYAQIEQKITKEQQDSLKDNLLVFLKNKHSLSLTYKDLIF